MAALNGFSTVLKPFCLDMLHDPLQHPVSIKSAGVDDHGVLGRFQRSDHAIAVLIVANADLSADAFRSSCMPISWSWT